MVDGLNNTSGTGSSGKSSGSSAASGSSASGNTISNTSPNANISKNEFLQLMIKQLQYQDPLNPTDSVDYSAQLAQYSSLEQLTNLNDKLSSLVETNYYLTQSVYNTMTTNLIGKEGRISSSNLVNNGQDSITLGFNLSGTPTKTAIKIYNSAGKLVRTIDDKEFSSGDNKLSWDFTDDNGKTLAKGTYTFKVEAKGSGDKDLTATNFIYGTVGSVKYTDDGTKIVIDGVPYAISDLLEIVDPEDSSGGNTGGK
jgi:flagellar basal-body rod modification protein FlgD